MSSAIVLMLQNSHQYPLHPITDKNASDVYIIHIYVYKREMNF